MRKVFTSLLRGNMRRVSPGLGGKQTEAVPPPPLTPQPQQAQADALGLADPVVGVADAPDALQRPDSVQSAERDVEAAAADQATMWKRRSGAWRWAVDLLIYGTLLGLLAAVEYGYMPAARTGFYCNDPKINFKFNGDTITVSILLVGSFLGPLLAFWLVEAGVVHARRGGGLWRCLRQAVRPTARWYREFVLGLGVVMFVTDAMKLLVSEPRPHFLDTCRPDKALNCSSASASEWIWIDDFACTNKRDSYWLVRDSMRSFPSGHTSISVFTALYVMIFLRRRMLRDITLLLVPWLQGMFLLWALVCSLSRITDHRHHWWDVLAGSVVGVVSALYTVRVFCDDFCPRHEDDSDDSLSSSPSPGPGAKGPGRPLLNGNAKSCACALACPDLDRDAVPARRLLSSSSSCASSLTAAEERELREVSTTS